MEPHRITETFAMHGNEMTWEGHLAVVEHMSTWPVDEIVDFHETLLGHLAQGAWIRTSVNRLIHHSDGSVSSAGQPLFDVAAMEAHGASHETLEFLRRQNADVLAFVPSETKPEIPAGSVGLPLHPWSGLPVKRLENDERTDRIRLRRARRAWEKACSTETHGEVSWILRAAPWAFHRKTGQRMTGVSPNMEEERWNASEPPVPWGGRYLLARGSDRVEVFRLWTAVSADEASVAFSEHFETFVRTLKARILSSEWVKMGGEFEPGVGWVDGQLIWEGPVFVGISEPNDLLMDILRTVQTPKKDRPIKVMPDSEFWALIGILGGDPRSDSWDELVTELARLTPAKIRGFEETLAAKLFAIDRPDLPATDSLGVGFSADVHLYFRCAVVIAGPEAWKAALSAPAPESFLADGRGEELLFVATTAHERRTGEPLDIETAVSYETGSNCEAWGEESSVSAAFRGWTVNTIEDGSVDMIRFWRASDRDAAISAQTSDPGRSPVVLGTMGILHHDSATNLNALAGVLYARAIGGTEA